MARNVLEFPSNNDGPAHEIRIFDNAGAQVGAVVAATHSGAGTYNYFATVPASLPTGWYAYNGYRSSNGRLRASGDFYWDNTTQCIIDTEEVELDTAAVETAVGNALTAYGAATSTDVANSTAAILAATPTAAAIAVAVEAAIINDADGQTALAAIAQSVEAAIGNEADGNATIAAFQGAVTAALNAYDPPTFAELDACCTNIQNDIAALANLGPADIALALTNYGAATTGDVNAAAGLTPGQSAILTLIRDLLEADEVYSATGGVGTVQKFIKGTTTVIADKTVATTTPCDINTSITETP